MYPSTAFLFLLACRVAHAVRQHVVVDGEREEEPERHQPHADDKVRRDLLEGVALPAPPCLDLRNADVSTLDQDEEGDAPNRVTAGAFAGCSGGSTATPPPPHTHTHPTRMERCMCAQRVMNAKGNRDGRPARTGRSDRT